MFRPRRSIAGFCIAVIVLAAFLPGAAVLDGALFEPVWILLPEEVVAFVVCPVAAVDEQTTPLLSLLPARAPPSPAVV
jgi:hypothetical protein